MPFDPQTQTGLLRVPQDEARALTVEGEYQIGVHEQLVEVAAGTGAATLTLPSVDEAGGRHYSIVTQQERDITVTGAGLGDDVELAAVGDAVLLYSDSRRWYVVSDMIATP